MLVANSVSAPFDRDTDNASLAGTGSWVVNTLSSLFTISHKIWSLSPDTRVLSCFPFCCFINKIFVTFLRVML